MTREKLNDILYLHELWLDRKENGKQADLRGADLIGVNLTGADLRYALLSEANLTGANLDCARFNGADLTNARLQFAQGKKVEFINANLSGADLRYAVLVWSDMSNANLSGADLGDTDLRGADFFGAGLSGTKFLYSPNFAECFGIPVYQASRGFGSRNGVLTLLAIGKREEWRWFTGCFMGSEAELRKAVQEKHGDGGNGYWEAMDYLVKQAEQNASVNELSKMQQIYSSCDWRFEQENDGTYTVLHELEKVGKVYLDNSNHCGEISFNAGVRLTRDDIHIIDVLLREMNANLQA